MKIPKNVYPYLEKLIDNKETAIKVADLLLFIYQNNIHPSKEEIIQIENNLGLSEKEAIFYYCVEQSGIDLDYKNNKEILIKYVLNNIKKEKIEKYIGNQYIKTVKPIAKAKGNYSLEYIKYDAFQLFPLDDLIINENTYEEFTPLGYFDSPYSYLALKKGRRILMSLNINEINTMQKHVDLANGNILVLGLGMGYFPFMCAFKEDVKSITIIEKDQNIINLFNDIIFDYFPNKEKITIIKSDAIKYLKDNHKYDYIFADIWCSPEDGIEPFVKLKTLEKKFKLNITYWISESLFAMLRRIAVTVLAESIDGYTDKDYLKPENSVERIICDLYFKTKELHIRNENDLNDFLNNAQLEALI